MAIGPFDKFGFSDGGLFGAIGGGGIAGSTGTGGTTASSGDPLTAKHIADIKARFDALMAADAARRASMASAMGAARMAKGGGMASGPRRASARPYGAMTNKERELMENLARHAVEDLASGDPVHLSIRLSVDDPYRALTHECEVMVTIRPLATYGHRSSTSWDPYGYASSATYATSGGPRTTYGYAMPDPTGMRSPPRPPPTSKPAEPRHPYYEWCDKNR
jgi:hypothetical protein